MMGKITFSDRSCTEKFIFTSFFYKGGHKFSLKIATCLDLCSESWFIIELNITHWRYNDVNESKVKPTGITRMFLSMKILSASIVVGPLAPSAMIWNNANNANYMHNNTLISCLLRVKASVMKVVNHFSLSRIWPLF